ncbi:hypothetical protein [Sandaracinus amylolyticus]|uniref:hypothetical protein n=1 Tax=Sandaracinus amylolyticus TaxID=927083 RepID=UPI001F1C5FC3|nr:hypothetical protein [Sandaracinus amylolyticus]
MTRVAMLALLLAGCAETGVLELQLMLPSKPATDTEPLFAQVQIRRASDHPFDVAWEGADVAAVELGAEPVRSQISVVGRDPELDLHVKVRFCRAPSCDALDDGIAPELWFEIERPFHVGRRTAWATCIESVPSAQPTTSTVVDRCDVHGCTSGAAATYCDGAGAHFCEIETIDEPPRDLRCVDGVADY